MQAIEQQLVCSSITDTFQGQCLLLPLYRRGFDKHREQKADTRKRGYLDIEDFRQFVKMLKYRPELERLHKTCSSNGCFDFPAFEKFMRDCQRVSSFWKLDIPFAD